MASKRFIVTFAGVQGSSKSIIAHYLSMEFGLPILNRDVLRYEVREDLRADDINRPKVLETFEDRFTVRWKAALAGGGNFILDCSVDRKWSSLKDDLEAAGYDWFIVNMELSRRFLAGLFEATGRQAAIAELDAYLMHHERFVREYGSDIGVTVTDDTFSQRNHVATEGLREFLQA